MLGCRLPPEGGLCFQQISPVRNLSRRSGFVLQLRIWEYSRKIGEYNETHYICCECRGYRGYQPGHFDRTRKRCSNRACPIHEFFGRDQGADCQAPTRRGQKTLQSQTLLPRSSSAWMVPWPSRTPTLPSGLPSPLRWMVVSAGCLWRGRDHWRRDSQSTCSARSFELSCRMVLCSLSFL